MKSLASCSPRLRNLAQRALAHLGLEDLNAAKDMTELRVLLSAWRDAKRSARKKANSCTQMRLLDSVPLMVGQLVELEALGLGDESPVPASLVVAGNAIIPFAPVHGFGSAREDGGLEIHWKRRSRVNYGWQDGIDQPLVEESEHYSVRFVVSGQIQGDWTVSAPFLSLSPAEAAPISSSGLNWAIEVRQTGRFGVSLPLVIANLQT